MIPFRLIARVLTLAAIWLEDRGISRDLKKVRGTSAQKALGSRDNPSVKKRN